MEPSGAQGSAICGSCAGTASLQRCRPGARPFSRLACMCRPGGRVPVRCRAEEAKPGAGGGVDDAQRELAELRREALPREPKRQRRQADSSDWVSSQLTRRFGLAGGLAWLGVLTFGVVGEQVKTRLENASEEKETQDVSNAPLVELPGGLSYSELRRGGGQAVTKGFLTVLHYRAFAGDSATPFEDTKARGKPIVFLYGARPFTAGLCLGVEQALAGMRGGGIRTVTVPPALGFGEAGVSLRGTLHAPGKAAAADVPPGAALRYELELVRVSIPPS